MQMQSLHKQAPHVWVAVGSDQALNMLLPLWEEHRRRGPAFMVQGNANDLSGARKLIGDQFGEILVLENPNEPPIRQHQSSPFPVGDRDCKTVLGWLRMNFVELRDYATRAAGLMKRACAGAQPIILLGPRDRRYLALLDELENATCNASEITTLRWSGERIRRTPMLASLRLGAKAALFSGHGNSSGWFAYGGVNGNSFLDNGAWSIDQTIGLLLSMSCQTGSFSSALKGGFADAVVCNGVAGAAFAPIHDTLHKANRALSQALVKSMADGDACLGNILRAAYLSGASLDSYVVVGDPGLEVNAAPQAMAECKKVSAPAAFENIGMLQQV
jgi:Peptidase family C25